MKMKKKHILLSGIFLTSFSTGVFSSFAFLESQQKPILVEADNTQKTTEATTTPLITVPEVEKEVATSTPVVINTGQFQYIQIIDSCGAHFEGECLNVRSGPGINFKAVLQIRNGAVLRAEKVISEEGDVWYKIIFDEWIHYPKRTAGTWYVSSNFVRPLRDHGPIDLTDTTTATTTTTTKRIIVSRGAQTLKAFEGDQLYMELDISTGIELSPTPRGVFTIFRKTPSRYMQGPLPGITNDYWDLPGVPWNLYFNKYGAAIHGAYWHEKFGSPASHGCVNVRPQEAEKLYHWADVGTPVVVTN